MNDVEGPKIANPDHQFIAPQINPFNANAPLKDLKEPKTKKDEDFRDRIHNDLKKEIDVEEIDVNLEKNK